MRPRAVLVGFQEQGNLGVGYAGAILMQRRFVAQIVGLPPISPTTE